MARIVILYRYISQCDFIILNFYFVIFTLRQKQASICPYVPHATLTNLCNYTHIDIHICFWNIKYHYQIFILHYLLLCTKWILRGKQGQWKPWLLHYINKTNEWLIFTCINLQNWGPHSVALKFLNKTAYCSSLLHSELKIDYDHSQTSEPTTLSTLSQMLLWKSSSRPVFTVLTLALTGKSTSSEFKCFSPFMTSHSFGCLMFWVFRFIFIWNEDLLCFMDLEHSWFLPSRGGEVIWHFCQWFYSNPFWRHSQVANDSRLRERWDERDTGLFLSLAAQMCNMMTWQGK